MVDRWQDAPFAAITPCLILGLTLARLLPQASPAGFIPAVLAFAAAAWIALERRRLAVAAACALAALTLSATLLALVAGRLQCHGFLRVSFGRGSLPVGTQLRFDGCLADDPVDYGSETVATVDLRAVEWKGRWIPSRDRVLLRVSNSDLGSTDEPLPGLQSGDRLRGWAAWGVPRNFHNPGGQDRVAYLGQRGIGVTGRVKSPRLLEVLPGDCASPWTRLALLLRNRAHSSFESLARDGRAREAAVLLSVVAGDYTRLDRATREVFQNSGTYHVLVVSGLHVAWIAAVILGVLRFLRLSETAGRLLASCSILLYACVVGWQASISRALWMFLLQLLGQSIFRRSSPVNIALASAFCLLVVRPAWLYDAGFQLSFLSVLAICATAAPVNERCLRPLLGPVREAGRGDAVGTARGAWDRAGRKARFFCELGVEGVADRVHPALEGVGMMGLRFCGRLLHVVAGMILVSLSVQLWLEPVLAFYFNRLSWIAPLANLGLVPVSSLVLAAGLVATLAASVPALGPWALTLAAATAQCLVKMAAWVSALPHAWQRCATPSAPAVAVLTVLMFAAWFPQSRLRFLVSGLSGLLILILGIGISVGWMPPGVGNANPAWDALRAGSPVLQLTFLDVGQGDAAVIRFPDGGVWVVDAGGLRETPSRPESGTLFDVGEAVVSRHLWWLWVRELDRMVLTHPHQDHAGGMPALLRNFRAAGLDYARAGADPVLAGLLQEASAARVATRAVASGHEWRRAGVRVRVLHPPEDGRARSTNDCSVVVFLEYGRFRGLLTGDIERASEAEILARHVDLRADLLKVAHHGGRSSSLDGFLERVRPRWGIVSAGRNNPFGHPARDTVVRLLRHGILPILTMDHGAVHFETDGRRFTLESYVGGPILEGSFEAK